jgi:hypothetical protein
MDPSLAGWKRTSAAEKLFSTMVELLQPIFDFNKN